MAVSASDFAWHASAVGKTILLSGAVGSGKSTIMRLGYRALSAHWGPTATIDTDTIVMMVDPTWELSDEERDYELAGWQIWLLARSFFSRGFECVLIGGNAPHTPDRGLNDLIGRLLGVGDTSHSIHRRHRSSVALRSEGAALVRSGSPNMSGGCGRRTRTGHAASTTRDCRRSRQWPRSRPGSSKATGS